MPAVEVRPASLSDLAELSQMDHSYLTQYAWQMDCVVEESQIRIGFREVRLPRQMRVPYPRPVNFADTDGQAIILAAIVDQVPVGYVRLKENLAPKTAWATDLVVHEQHRRQGIGSVLAVAAQDWAMQRGLRRVILEMQSKNFPAIRMAFKLGYEFCGYNDHYYPNQDIAVFFARYLR